MTDTPIFSRKRVTIVGVLNVTPDSFSDGGRFVGPAARVRVREAVAAGCALAEQGADVIDVGGESTRPGARAIPAAVEIARTAPVIEGLARAERAVVSIDTRKADVARRAIAAGARVVNDVSGGAFDPELLEVAAASGVRLILGHLRGDPETMQEDPRFEDVLKEVSAELAERVERAERAGVPRERIVVDPGIGFGKRPEHNLTLLAHAGWLARCLGCPVLVGPSRKSFLGRLTGDPVDRREAATAAACAVALFAGADAIRVHDVEIGRRVAVVARALRAARGGPA